MTDASDANKTVEKSGGERGSPDNDNAALETGKLSTAGLDHAPVAMVITDPTLPDNPIVYVNDAFTQLTGYSRSASMGRNCRFLQGPDTERTTVKELREAIDARDPVALDIVNYRSDGSSFINSLSITPIRDDGRTIFFLGIQSGPLMADDFDVDRKALRGHLHDLQTVIEDQVGVILATIRDYVGEETSASRTSQMLASRVESIAQLYDGFYQRQSQGKGRVRLGAYLGRVCSATHLSHRDYNIRLNTHFEEAVCDIETAAKLGLLLSEILSAAFAEIGDVEEDTTAITVSFIEHEGEGVLSVSDQVSEYEHEIMPSAETIGSRILAAIVNDLGSDIRVERADDGVVLSIGIPGVQFPDRRSAFPASEVYPAS